MNTPRFVGWICMTLLVASQASAQIATGRQSVLELQVRDQVLSAEVSQGEIRGENILLTRTDEGWKGQVFDDEVQLRVDPSGLIQGTLGEEPVRIQAWHQQQGMDVEGWIAGVPGELSVNPTSIRGTLGGCSYQLVLKAERYTGSRNCNGTYVPELVELQLPTEAARMTTAELGGLLVSLLGGHPWPE